MSSIHDRRSSLLTAAAVVVVLLTGCDGSTPSPSAAWAAATTAPSAAASFVRELSTVPAPLAASSPTTASPAAIEQRRAMAASGPVPVRIPSTGTESCLLPLGLRENGSLEVPPGGPGDTIEVAREDGSTAVFAVERGEQRGNDAFPTSAVYGNTEGTELRLITCDGYDPTTGEFDDNYVVDVVLAD